MTIVVLRPVMERAKGGGATPVLSIVEETLVLTPDQLDIFEHMDEVPESAADLIARNLTGERQREQYEFLRK